jgi:hypothetical protein
MQPISPLISVKPLEMDRLALMISEFQMVPLMQAHSVFFGWYNAKYTSRTQL